MSEIKLGELIEGEAYRDAVHIAVAPVVAGEDLTPGQHVFLLNGKGVGVSHKTDLTVGVVDPYLDKGVATGKKFWLFLYRDTVKSIRHAWTHPEFPDESAMPVIKTLDDRKQWITNFAVRWGFNYEQIMAGAAAYAEHGQEMDDNWAQLDVPETEWEVFWNHFEAITGIKPAKRDEFIHCCPGY